MVTEHGPMRRFKYAYRIQAFQKAGMELLDNFYAIDAETSPDATDDHIRLMDPASLRALPLR